MNKFFPDIKYAIYAPIGLFSAAIVGVVIFVSKPDAPKISADKKDK
jgi:multidrug transporter EmrE-like cation transporter